MSAAAANVPSPASLAQSRYVHPGTPQHLYFQMTSNCFQATGKIISEKDTFNSENGPPEAIPKGIYLNATHALDRAEKKVKRLDHRYPIRLEENEYLKPSTTQTKEGYLNRQQMRPDTASAETNLRIEPPHGPPNSTQNIARVVNVHKCLACNCLPINECPDNDARRSLVHFKSTHRSHVRVNQNGHPVASENESFSGGRVAYLKPRGYQIQPTKMPVTKGNPVHLAFSGIQSNASQMEPNYPMNIQNLRLPRAHGNPKHYPQPMWRNPAPVPFTHSVHSYPDVRPNLIRENQETDANSVKCRPFNVVASNAIQPILPLSNSVMPPMHHSSSGSDYYPVRSVREMTTDSSSASTFRAVQASTVTSPGGIRSAIPAESPYNPLLSRGENEKDSTSTKGHVCCESPKQVTAALPVHIMNAVPRDVHLVSHPPARLLPIYTPEEADENRPLKTDFPVHVYVPPTASRVPAPRPCHAADLNSQSCSAEVYNTWDVRQPVSANASQSLKTKAPSQVPASEGPIKVPIQYSYQSTFEGFCRPSRKEISAPNHRIDSMNSVHQETPSSSKSNAMMVAPLRRPNYVAQAICQPARAQSLMTSNLRFISTNGDVPQESRNANPTQFHVQGKSRGQPCSRVRPWIVPKRQLLNQNSGNGFKYDDPSSWSNNASGYASPNMTRGYQTILPRHSSVCDNLSTTKEPHCYISVDSKPQDNRKFSEAATRCREMVQSREDRMPCVDQEQRAKQLEKLTQFVVGVETKIHWNKIRNNSENSNWREEQNMQITNVSSTHNSRDDPTDTHSNLSRSESDDAFCMMRLERVYYSISAIPSPHAQSSAVPQEQGSEPNEFAAGSHKGNVANSRGDTHQIIANCEYSSEQSSSVATRNKTSKGLSLGMKVHKNAQVPDSSPVKRKANVSSTKRDEVCKAKRKKIVKNKSSVSPKGTVSPALEKVKKSVEVLPMKKLTVQLESGSKTFLKDLKSEETVARIIRERIRKRCARKAWINS